MRRIVSAADQPAAPKGETSLGLTSLNGDSSWLIEIDGTRLLLDPWLEGTALVVSPALHQAHLGQPPIPVDDLPDVEALVISHPFADHLNLPTLRRLPRDLPVYAPSVVRSFMRHLARFPDVTHLGNGAKGAAPSRVGNIDLIWCRATAPLDTTHNALMFRGRRTGTTVVYSPHGVLRPSPTLEALERLLAGRLDALMLSFTLLDLPGYLGGVANLGEQAAVELTAHLKPRFVMGTHDGPKPDEGFISRVERIVHCPDIVAALGDRAPGTTPVLPRVGETWSPGNPS